MLPQVVTPLALSYTRTRGRTFETDNRGQVDSLNSLILIKEGRLKMTRSRKKEGRLNLCSSIQPPNYDLSGVPKGIRTPVAAVKGRCPWPG